MLLADLLGRDEPFVRVRRRHADVDDGDVGRVGTDLQQQLVGVTRLAHDLEAGILEQARDALPQQHRVAGVDADPDADGADRRLLNRLGRSDRLPRIDESDRELVAATVDLLAAVLDERGADGDAMLLERRRIVVTKRLYEPRRALDVGEQEGDAHTTSLRNN